MSENLRGAFHEPGSVRICDSPKNIMTRSQKKKKSTMLSDMVRPSPWFLGMKANSNGPTNAVYSTCRSEGKQSFC
jgi:hypothetical protein